MPMPLVVAALGIAAGSGGTVAVAKDKLDKHSVQIQDMERDQRAVRENQVRIQTLLEQVSKTVDRIERKLDAPDQ